MPTSQDARVAVLSDAHGNAEALRSVLHDMEALGLEQAVFLGDAVGYGPEPVECLHLLRQRGIPMVLGNHELGLVRAEAREWFNTQSRMALDRTRELMDDESMAFIATLPQVLLKWDTRFVHGAPPDKVSTYLYELGHKRFRELFALYPERLCFVGHTHELAVVFKDNSKIKRMTVEQGVFGFKPDVRYMVNVGSVGQPRDGDNRAKYVVWDREADEVEIRCVSYDIARTVALMEERGLPRVYADRLW